MSKTAVIHQPDFAPWLGYFERLIHADLLIVFDDVQFVRRGWHHRDKIKTQQGPDWLSLPTIRKGKFEQNINQVQLSYESDWTKKHLERIRHAYCRAPYFDTLFPQLSDIYETRPERMLEFNQAILEWMLGLFEIQIQTVYSSETPSENGARNNRRLVELLETHQCDRYLTGTGSRAYLDESLFAERGFEVIWQDYTQAPYSQQFGEFVPMLSSLDYLFNCGPGNPF